MSSGTPANPVARSNVEPNTIINMDRVYKQARNNARRRANNLERQRMAIASAQRAARNANAARRAANIVGPTPTRRVRKKFTPSLASVPENNEMSGGRRSRRKSTRK